eukprot:TRINITY_DN6969_c0_g1_i1.p1 TRINITY_DN6969_c0_g1~~TRINITY_DN6969_c0_g1_i1.p1  ORF type:complete len:436 (+),score=64.05 TRINITY_DN6969_c0_g1_i1:23-1309(+)
MLTTTQARHIQLNLVADSSLMTDSSDRSKTTTIYSLSDQILLHIISFIDIRFVFSNLSLVSKLFHCIILSLRTVTRDDVESLTIPIEYTMGSGYFIELASPARKDHPIAYLYPTLAVDDTVSGQSKKLISFGGNRSSPNGLINHVTKDILAYDFETKDWEISDTGFSLTEHTMIKHNGKLFIFGGTSGFVTTYSSLILEYQLPFRKGSGMKTEEVLGSLPRVRSAHSSVMYNGDMYIFGGWNSQETYGDFYCFNFDAKQWREIPTLGAPSKRRMHTSVVYKDSMFVFGGYDDDTPAEAFNDVYKYNFLEDRWTKMECKGQVPRGRSRATAVVWRNEMFVLGGTDRKTTFLDFYSLNLDTLVWRKIYTNLERDYGVCGIEQHSCTVYGDWMFVFGGKLMPAGIPTSRFFACRLGVSEKSTEETFLVRKM